MTTMRTVRLGGELADGFGATHRLAVSSVAEAVVAIDVNQPGFRAALRDLLDRGYRFQVTVAGRDIADGDVALVSRGDVLIVPVVMGANSKALAVVGVGLIAVAWMNPAMGTAMRMAMFGIGGGLAVGGVLGMMARVPTGDAVDASKGGKSSYVFGSGQSAGVQGVPVPVGCGVARGAGIVISAGIDVEDMG